MSCITLLSDFGLQDASVASAKGILMQHAPAAQFVDITHLVEPFHLQQAAYLLLASYRNFPKGTCHVQLFDIFSEKAPRLVLCQYEGHYFLAPDNGLLSLAFGAAVTDVWQCYELPASGVFRDWLIETGRVAAQLQTDAPADLGLSSCTLKNAPHHWLPKISEDEIECHVIHIDRYENVVINLRKEDFEEHLRGRSFCIQFMRNEELTQLSTHFYNVNEGMKLCRFNATGYLEIAINRGRAASLFGFKLFREKHLIYNSIKIFFK
jgi:S-adenosylmethionine hydrolase